MSSDHGITRADHDYPRLGLASRTIISWLDKQILWLVKTLAHKSTAISSNRVLNAF
jgi:hypothetical protein